jgi:hypothetical protein
MSKLVPKYTMWEALNATLSLGQKALDEIRTLARMPGPAGKDGIGVDNVKVKHLDKGRIQIFSFMLKGEVVSEQRLVTSNQIYRGVYQDGKQYLCGDTVTWSGSQWHCDAEETTEKPGHVDGNDKAWTLSVKRGSDGKDGKDLVTGPLPSVKIDKPDGKAD